MPSFADLYPYRILRYLYVVLNPRRWAVAVAKVYLIDERQAPCSDPLKHSEDYCLFPRISPLVMSEPLARDPSPPTQSPQNIDQDAVTGQAVPDTASQSQESIIEADVSICDGLESQALQLTRRSERSGL